MGATEVNEVDGCLSARVIVVSAASGGLDGSCAISVTAYESNSIDCGATVKLDASSIIVTFDDAITKY